MQRKRVSFLLRLLGYCVIEIPIFAKENFLNLCMRYGFNYYKISIDEKSKKVHITLSATQYKRVLTACRIWEIRAKTVSRGGLPQMILRYRKRWGIAVGLVLSVLLFFALQSVVWRIDITGNERLSEERITESLLQNGLYVGGRISKLDTDYIEHRIMINDDDIAWISIKIVGTVARVEVKEVIDTEIIEEGSKPANLVSRFDAQIVSLEVLSGFINVKEGDFVRAGELLVSGIYESEKAPIRYSRASGKIFGRVTKEFVVEIPLVQEKKVLNGEKITKKTLNFFGKSIKFFINYRNLPTSYDIINYIYVLNPFSLGELPISLSVDEYYGYEMVEAEISEEEAINQAYELLRARIDEVLPEAQILKKSLQGEIVDGKYVLKCTVTAICDIAKQVEFEVVTR
ncbi:MAG: sporulation protein YqfD [Clostridia bacterium]|nr:sporulation protein YqfD [Clostridia bacterium]